MGDIFRNFWQNVVGIERPIVRPRIVLRPRRPVRDSGDEPESETAEDEGEALAAELAALEQQADAADDNSAVADRRAAYAESQAQDAFHKAQVMGRLAALVNPFKQAIAANGPNAPQLQMLFGMVKTSLGQKQYVQAAEALDLMETMLGQEAGGGNQEPGGFGQPNGVDDYGNPIGAQYDAGYAQPGYPVPGADPYQMPGNQGGVPGLVKYGRPEGVDDYGNPTDAQYGAGYAQPGYPAPGADPYQTPTNYPGAAPGQNPDLFAQLDAQRQHAELTDRANGLFGPFRQALMNDSPDSAQLETAFDTIQKSLDSQQFPLAEEWLDYMEQLLAQQASGQPGEIGDNVNLENLAVPFGGQETREQRPQQMMFPGGPLEGLLGGGLQALQRPGSLGEQPPENMNYGTPEEEQPESETDDAAMDSRWANPFVEENAPPAPPSQQPTPTTAVNANCLITVTNNTEMVLTLIDQSNYVGDFMSNPANSIQPGGTTSFVFVHTPNDNDPADAGCSGGLTWQVGKPVADTWILAWNNMVGKKNTAEGSFVLETAGFRSLEQIGQGDENVPVTFTISGGNAGPVPEPVPVPPAVLVIDPIPPVPPIAPVLGPIPPVPPIAPVLGPIPPVPPVVLVPVRLPDLPPVTPPPPQPTMERSPWNTPALVPPGVLPVPPRRPGN